MKKLTAVFAALALVMFTGCGSSKNSDAQNAQSTPVQNVTANTVTTASDQTFSLAHGVFTAQGNTLVSVTPDSVAVAPGIFRSGTLTCKVHSTDATDSGVIFGLRANGNTLFWESGVSYYFYFLGRGGTAYLGKVLNGGWFIMNTVNIGTIDGTRDYTLKVVVSDNRITCFADGKLMFGVKDPEFIDGNGYGVRTGAAGIVFDGLSVTDTLDYTENA